MERLTVNKGQEYDGTAGMLKVYYRLADYEDIGTVEEFAKLKTENDSLKKQLENSAQLIKDYKHFIEYDIERLYYIIETAEREETENENNMSVWSVGYDTDYDSYEQMTALEERIGHQALSRLVTELKKGVKLRKIGTAEAEASLKELRRTK